MKKERLQKRLYQIISSYFATYLLLDRNKAPIITIREISIAPRADSIKVWLSFISSGVPFDAQSFLEKEIKPHTWQIKKEIAQSLRHMTRKVPKEVRFYLDDTPKKAARLEEIIRDVMKEEERRGAS